MLLVYAPVGLPAGGLDAWPEMRTSRVVETRLVSDEDIDRRFGAPAWLALGSDGAGYVAVRSR